MRNTISVLTFLLAAAAPLSAQANPIAKLCRASTAVREDYREFWRDTLGFNESARRASARAFCFHAGRIMGAIEDGMTFRDRAREKTPPVLLALADEAVARARALKPFCLEAESDAAVIAEALRALAGDQDGSLNMRIFSSSCGPGGIE